MWNEEPASEARTHRRSSLLYGMQQGCAHVIWLRKRGKPSDVRLHKRDDVDTLKDLPRYEMSRGIQYFLIYGK